MSGHDMRTTRPDILIKAARADLEEHNLKRARDRLREVLRESPQHRPALELMGQVYYQYGDYRNAAMYWCQADRWDAQMRHACGHVFKAAARALTKENVQATRYQLYVFAGGSPPPDMAEKVASLQRAYYRLDEKRSRLAGLTCAPVAGVTIVLLAGTIFGALKAGWSSFLVLGGIGLVTTGIVLGINGWLYYRASRNFRQALDPFRPS